jgi:cell division initiation protein
MSVSPVEIRHVTLPRGLAGYRRRAVDGLLEDIRLSYEDVWRERADAREDIDRLESELARYKELEVLLRNALVSAERSADELRAQARREADLILEEARVKAREIASAAEGERERVRAEIRRLRALEADVRRDYRAFLVTALERIEEAAEEREAPEQAA